jgi:putative inorganic carbon (HCO3(-)) transporter
MKLVNFCNRVIEYSFYSLLFLVPLVLAGDTSELFEFNKMWVAFAVGTIIAVAWAAKSILSGRIGIQRTPLDIPIVLFLISQILATIFSWDRHISVWGYYSRWNGGLLSTLLYIFLYYAFVSSVLSKESIKDGASKIIKRFINVSLISGIIVSIWGIPSYFGYDPTCFLFRGSLDVACWADDFQPKARIFSTLGQPDWLAAYIVILLPISLALALEKIKEVTLKKFKFNWILILYLTSFILFYLDLLYAKSRSGLIASWLAILFVLGAYLFYNLKKSNKFMAPAFIALTVIILTFLVSSPFSFINQLTFSEVKKKVNPPSPAREVEVKKPAPAHTGELGGTDSGKIRLLVWEGALNAWKNNPILGTGVETFAFAYYKYKPEGHNLVSEWNFLYNKAHNEFLNLLSTTGIVGFGTYIAIIGYFLYLALRKLIRKKDVPDKLLVTSFIASYLAIAVTNFFGFSVVIVNIYLFLIPAFTFAILELFDYKKQIAFPKSEPDKIEQASPFQIVGVIAVLLMGIFVLFNLLNYWNADKAYGYGSNLGRVGYYQEANPHLQKAVSLRPGEPVFRDELAINNAILATMILSQETKNATEAASTASQLSDQAISISDDLVNFYPNNYVFWKTRVRIFYTLAQVDPRMLSLALEAVRKAQELAPNDANINFNLGVIEGQNGNVDNGIKFLERTIKLKPDYRDARYALGLFYYQKGSDKDGSIKDKNLVEKAKNEMKYILERVSSGDLQAKESLKQFEASE